MPKIHWYWKDIYKMLKDTVLCWLLYSSRALKLFMCPWKVENSLWTGNLKELFLIWWPYTNPANNWPIFIFFLLWINSSKMYTIFCMYSLIVNGNLLRKSSPPVLFFLGNDVCSLFCNLSETFDSVLHLSLLNKHSCLEVNPYLLRWIR